MMSLCMYLLVFSTTRMLVSEGRDLKKVIIIVDFQRCVNFCCVCLLSHLSPVQLFATLWTVAHQAPLSTGFSRQGYYSGLSFPFSGHLPNPEMEPVSPTSPPLAGGFFTTDATWEAPISIVQKSKCYAYIFFSYSFSL